MVLAGSYWQIPLIRKIKELGYDVINVNPYENSPAFAYADESVMLDILDKERCLECAKDAGISAVMSEQCDIANPSVAYIAEQLGLPTIGQKQAELYTNKLWMRKFCKENNFVTPEFKECFTIEDAIDFYVQLNKKMIIKPLDSNSSRGVYTINSVDDIKKHFEEAKGYSKVEKAVLCEEYIDGTEFTVDGIVTDKGHVSLAISEKAHYKHNPNVACTLFFSHKNQKYDYDLLRRVNDSYVDLTGLPYGLTHAEYKFNNGKYYLIEIGARGGGNLIGSDIVPLISGVDNYSYLIEKSLGHEVTENFVISDKFIDRCVILQFFDTIEKEGRVKEIEGLDILKKNPNVVAYRLNFKTGDIVRKAKDDSARIGFYIAYGETREALESLKNKINSTIKIKLEEL